MNHVGLNCEHLLLKCNYIVCSLWSTMHRPDSVRLFG